jgi:hypothetical protein
MAKNNEETRTQWHKLTEITMLASECNRPLEFPSLQWQISTIITGLTWESSREYLQGIVKLLLITTNI